MAKGKLRGSDSNNKIPVSNVTVKNGETYISEYEINDIPPSARTLLTKGYVQDEINFFSGATVSTRGRFMTEQEKLRCPNERSLYLYIQGHRKHHVDLAIQKINEIVKSDRQNSLHRPSRFTNELPPLMSLDSTITSVEKICIGIDNSPPGFDLRGRIIGVGGANLLYIRGETGANVTLRGRGSQFVDPAFGSESPEPLHLYIEHSKPEALQNAKQLVINLIQTIQSELQTYIQQQPPPVQSHRVIEQSHIQQNQFQTMNIGALGQPNVVTIQHQDIIQHPQSNVVTLPATILTATVTGASGPGVSVPPPGVHIPPHSGPLVPHSQPQEIQTFVPPPPPPSVGQVQLLGPQTSLSQVQYQIHPGQPLQIQGIPPGSQSSPQPVTQMYVMSQPPPQGPTQQAFISSANAPVGGAVSYVCAQPNMQRPPTPSQGMVEAVNVNLQQPPPATPLSISQQPPPPHLLHLHFPPPNFPPNQPPPTVPQTYQIQYQHVQAPPPQTQTQFVLQSGEHIVSSQLQHNHDQPQGLVQHMMPSQFEGHPPQFHLQVPPPSAQTFLVPNAPSPQHFQQPPLPPGSKVQHQQDGPGPEQGPLPQPVPPPQAIPPPPVTEMSNSINVLTSMPPPTQQTSSQNAPWLYHAPQSQQMQQSQGPVQIQMPTANMPIHNVPPPQMQSQMQYHGPHVQYQNGHVPTQIHYAVHPSQHHQFDEKLDSPEQQKPHGIKRRFSDVEGSQDSPPYQCGPLPAQRHGTGEGDRHQQVLHGPPTAGAGLPHGDRNKPLIPPPHPGENRIVEHKATGLNSAHESLLNTDCGNSVPGGGLPLPQPPPLPPPPPQAPWQTHHVRAPWDRPPPIARDGEQYPPCPVLPPTNMPPPQIRLKSQSDDNRSLVQNVLSEHTNEYHQVAPYNVKPPAYNSHPLMQSICNPPPPPPPPHLQQRPQPPPQSPQHYQPAISQAYHPPVSCPPWMN